MTEALSGSRREERAPRVTALLLLVLAGAAGLRLRDFTQPWSTSIKGRCGALYSTAARNHLRYGYLATRLAMTTCGGQRHPAELANHRYLNHPPFLGVMLALGFRAFGVHEWSARLGPLVFSVLSVWLLFVALRRLAGPAPALIAAALMAALPMAAYYGAFVDVLGAQVMFAALGVFLLYWRWHETRRRRYLWGLLAAFGVGTTMDWPLFLLAGALFVHHVVSPGVRGRSRAMGLVPLAMLVAFAGHLVAIYVLAGGRLTGLRDAFIGEHNQGVSLQLWDANLWAVWARMQEQHFLRMYTAPVLILGGLWLVRALAGAMRRRAPPGSSLVFCFAFMGLGYVALFPAGSYLHEYMSMFVIPALCTAAALLLWEGTRLLGPAGVRRAVTAGCVMALVAHLGIVSWRRYEPGVSRAAAYYVTAGRDLRAATRPADVVSVVGLESEGPAYTYYADRTIRMTPPEPLAAKLAGGWPAESVQGRYVALPARFETHPLEAMRGLAPLRPRLEALLGAAARPVASGSMLVFATPAAR